MSVLSPGTPAPEFTLKTEDGDDFTRDDLEGRTTVLVFYPNSFSPVCTDQLNIYDEVLGDIEAEGGIYGTELSLDFLERLRGERRFPSVDDLLAQMAQDVEATRRAASLTRS